MARNDHHQERVNRVLDYISRNLDGDLSLATLSGVGCFSPYHFHRIFQAVTSETVNNHVRRVRLERAAALMKASPQRRITDVALEAGFAGTAEFSRAFKSHFNRTASSWDRRSPLEKSKICKAPEMLSYYSVEELESWRAEQKVEVVLTNLTAFRYVYTRIFEPYGNTKLVDAYFALSGWLKERGTSAQDVFFVGMSLDDPSITPSKNCRYDMGVAFPTQLDGGMFEEALRDRGRMENECRIPDREACSAAGYSLRDFEPMKVAAIHCVGGIGNVDRAWHYLYRIWLPEVDYEPADLPGMQVFIRLPEEIGWETFDLQACLPVVRP